MSRKDHIVTEVIAVVLKHDASLAQFSLAAETDLRHPLINMDSLDFVELIMDVEDEFKIDIPDEAIMDTSQALTIGRLADLVMEHNPLA